MGLSVPARGYRVPHRRWVGHLLFETDNDCDNPGNTDGYNRDDSTERVSGVDGSYVHDAGVWGCDDGVGGVHSSLTERSVIL